MRRTQDPGADNASTGERFAVPFSFLSVYDFNTLIAVNACGLCLNNKDSPMSLSTQLSAELLEVLEAARGARGKAYAPYSGFQVGSAVKTDDGRLVFGANVENASYGLTVCAERNAVMRAVIEKRCRIVAVAVCASPLATPCGMCRQTLVQFAQDDCPIILGTPDRALPPQIRRLGDLIPDAFRLKGLYE